MPQPPAVTDPLIAETAVPSMFYLCQMNFKAASIAHRLCEYFIMLNPLFQFRHPTCFLKPPGEECSSAYE